VFFPNKNKLRKMINDVSIFSSFRDPSGSLFLQDSSLYRRVNLDYKENYDLLMNSGLYKTLVGAGLLIAHEEVDLKYIQSNRVYKIIKPELIPFVSYPYEWCFSQLKDAALTTLKIQKIALQFGMSLKDSSAYNIQFRKGKPILIDTLSFEKYLEDQPWVAYRQFCQHFLAPLVLMNYVDVRLNQLLRSYIDGIPLDLVSLLLPFRSRLKFSLFSHIHLHAKSDSLFAGRPVNINNAKMGHFGIPAIIDSLDAIIRKQKLKYPIINWANYYQDTNYSEEALQYKKNLYLNS
jgi:hypothetical protein